MLAFLPVLASLVLICTSQLSAACDVNQCESQLDPSKCVEPLDAEEMNCVTYTCQLQASVGHGVLVRDEEQEIRCSIGGHCYKVGEGPNLCTYCQQNEDGSVGINPGCLHGGECLAPGSIVENRCLTKICSVEHQAASLHLAGTVGCELYPNCFSEGEKIFTYTCNECVVNPENNYHEWYRECRDPRNNQCFLEDSVYDIYCRTFICSNRGGIGWHRHNGDSCEITEVDCVAVGSFSLRDGFCYYCEAGNSGQISVGCSACGQCLKNGESATCDEETYSCGELPDPPDNDDIICRVGEGTPDLEVGDVTEYQCNSYTCTILGVRQLTQRCSYQGECYNAGDMIDESNCLMCVSDGASTTVEQGCRHEGQCISQGERIRVNCRTKECIQVRRRLRFVNTDDQPTPCRCLSNCYPVGVVDYAHEHLCAECKPDGTINYACKLHNGDCLPAGTAETVPSYGCYAMQCSFFPENSTYMIHKAPGQPLRCHLPGGGCLDENQRAEVNGQTYVCLAGDVCLYKNETIPVGDEIEDQCHTLVCDESEHLGVKVLEMGVIDYGCKYGDSCKALNEQYEIDCNAYTCRVKEGDKYANNELLTQRCECDGFCMDVGQYYWTPNCARRECMPSYKVEVTERGCLTSENVCLEPGSSGLVNNVTEYCEDGEEGGGGGGGEMACDFSGQIVPFGDTVDRNCNSYRCEQRGQYIGLYMISDPPRCKMIYKDNPICFAAGTTEHCVTCNYNENDEQPFSFEQDCIGEDGTCVEDEQSAPYHCGTGVCNPLSKKMEVVHMDDCKILNVCIPPDEWMPVEYQGSMLNCTCDDPTDREGGYKCYW